MRSLCLLQLSGAVSASILLTGRDNPNWTYQGCYLDSTSKRTLAHSSGAHGNDQTIETCTSSCQTGGFNWAGVEYGSECWCDYQLSGATQEPETDCSMPCAGNSSQICGNGDRLSVYYNGNTYTGPSANPGPPGWTYLACYTDSGSSRTLRTSQGVSAGSDNMTVAQCTDACQSNGYSMAGVEYGRECWCDDAIQDAASIAQSGCDMTCTGNSTEYCGGSNRVNVYQVSNTSNPGSGNGSGPSGWTSLGCFTDSASSRTLETSPQVQGGGSNMTIEGCLAVCSSQGFVYAGLEFAQECFCGASLKNGGSCASDQSTCYQPCQGKKSETCGGPNRLNIYYSGSDTAVVACSASVSSTVSSISSTLSVSTTSATSSSAPTTLSTSSLISSSSTSSSSSSSIVSTSTSSLSSSSISSTATSSSSSIPISTSSSLVITSSITTISSSTTTSKTSTSTSPVSTVCPSFWTNIIADLAPSMRVNGQCTNLARAAIRFAFHDAATYSTKLPFYAPAAGGADGSLLLSPDEINRKDNDGLHDYYNNLTQKLASYQSSGYAVGAADLIQVAGALGVLACPGGRIGRVLVGRLDTNVTAPDGLLPAAFGAGSDHDTILNLFSDKGFSPRDLAALIGAHSTSIANFQQANGIPSGTPQDNTPGLWDVDYYNQTYFPPAGMARFDSDVNLSKNVSSLVGKQFKSFVGAQGAWGASFSSAYQVLSLLGVTSVVKKNMQDCTSVVGNANFGS